MQGEQRGTKEHCRGTSANLLIARMVCQDSQRGHRNLNMAWIEVRKAYDTRIAVRTVNGLETSQRIRFSKGLPWGHSLMYNRLTSCARATQGFANTTRVKYLDGWGLIVEPGTWGLGRARCWSRRVYVSSVLGYGTWPKILKEKRGKAPQHPLLKKTSRPMTKGQKHNVSFTDSEPSSSLC